MLSELYSGTEDVAELTTVKQLKVSSNDEGNVEAVPLLPFDIRTCVIETNGPASNSYSSTLMQNITDDSKGVTDKPSVSSPGSAKSSSKTSKVPVHSF